MKYIEISPRRRAAAVGVAVLAIALFCSRGYVWSYDGYVMRQVAYSMVTDHSFLVYDDPLGLSTPYAAYGIGMSLFMAVCEVAARILGASATSLESLINPVVLAAVALVVWSLARRCGAGPRLSAASALVVAVATPLLPYAATTFSELPTALGVALALLGIAVARGRPVVGGALVGAGVGLATLMRFDSLALVAPIVGVALLVAARERRLAALACATAAVPGLAVVAAYNMLRYSSPLQTRYQDIPTEHAWGHSILTGIYGLLLSPGRGLLVYAPIVLVVGVFWRPVWRRSPALALTCAVLLADRVLVYAAWHAWHGGVTWGPRFLVPAMPALTPFVVEALRWAAPRLRPARLGAVGIVALLGLSVAIQVTGALTDPAKDRLMASIHEREAVRPGGLTPGEWYVSAQYQRIWDDALADWSLAPVIDHAGRLLRGRNGIGRFLSPVNPIGIALTALVAGLALAAALRGRRVGGEPPAVVRQLRRVPVAHRDHGEAVPAQRLDLDPG